MLSALQGKLSGSKSSSPDPYSGLHYSRIASRCSHISASITSLPLKELHQFFPHLLSNIFGFDRSEGWGLKLFNKTQHGDFHQLIQFLGPHGDLFQLINKLDTESFIYEFPVECLPHPSQQALIEGIVPPFYSDKVQLSFSVDNSPTHIFLSAFEYYIFHFAYYLIHSQLSPSRSPPPNLSETLFVNLLDSYLNHYLPFTGTIPPSLTSSLTRGSPHFSLTTPPGFNTSFGSSIGQSSPYNMGVASPLKGGARMRVSSPHKQSVQQTRTETFVQVLIEFWLNQNTYNGGRGDLLAQAQNQFIPNEEHLVLLRRLLKQVHYFGCGYSYSSTTTTLLSGLIPITDTLRSSLVSTFVQKRLYHFLNYSFKHSPLDFNFRYILELWLTFLQPWRYIDPSKSSTENKESFESLPKKWRSFVLDNFPFYSSLLVEFLGRCFQADLTTEINVTLLYRVSKVFALPGLMGFIEHGETLLLDSAHSRRSSPTLSSSSIKAVFIDTVGPSSDYTPVFGQDTQEAIHSLLYKVCHSKSLLNSKMLSQSSHHSPSTPPPGSPHTHHTPSTSFTVSPPSHHTSSQPTQAPNLQPLKRSFFSKLWSSLVDVFSDDTYTPHPGHSSQTGDPRKLVNLLSTIADNLSTVFKLPIPKVTIADTSVLGSAVPLGATPMMYPGHTPPQTPPTSLEPEYLYGSSKLSPQGREQVIQGLRKCSGRNVLYQGDPLLQPIRSYENATLVRLLHNISTRLNERYAAQLVAVGAGHGLLNKLLFQLLAPPPPRPHETSFLLQESLDPPVTPVSRITRVITYHDEDNTPQSPRINLRPFGSYYVLTYILLVIVFVWVFSVPTPYCLLAVFCFVLMYCLVSYCVHGTQKNTKKRN